MKKFVSWDSEKHLNFAVPFVDMKPVIYLDIFLPRVTELALSASDRQTKVFAFSCFQFYAIAMRESLQKDSIPSAENPFVLGCHLIRRNAVL